MKQQTGQNWPTSGYKTQLQQLGNTLNRANTQFAKLQKFGGSTGGTGRGNNRTTAARNTGARGKRSAIAT